MASIYNQIYNIVNDSVRDTVGGTGALTDTLDSSDLVSLGTTLSNDNLYEQWFSNLTNRLVKTVYRAQAYRAKQRGILRDETEWGAFKQKVHYNIVNAVANPALAIPDTSSGTPSYAQHSPYDVETTVEIKGLLFGTQGTWSIEIIRPIAQIMSAFTNSSEMMSFIDGIYITIEESMQLELESVEALAANTGIAYSLKKGKSINLLQEYNAQASTPVTVAGCLYSLDFLKFAAQRISETVGYMGRATKLYNSEGLVKYTDRDRLTVEVLSKFASQSAFYLQSDTYHKELVELPRYTPIEFWQSPGSSFAFNDISKINIQHDDLILDSDDASDTGTVNQGGIIAFLHDIEYVAAYFGERYSWEDMNKRDRIMIHGEQARKGYAVDPNENAIVFYVADTPQLGNLAISSLTLTPTFDAGKYSYTSATENATNTLTATSTTGDVTAELNGTALTLNSSGNATLTWEDGANELVVTVSDPDVPALYTEYTITVTKS